MTLISPSPLMSAFHVAKLPRQSSRPCPACSTCTGGVANTVHGAVGLPACPRCDDLAHNGKGCPPTPHWLRAVTQCPPPTEGQDCPPLP